MKLAWILVAGAVCWAADDGAQRGPLELSLRRAVEIAISPEGNMNVVLAGEALKQARDRSLESRASLLPDLESSVTYENRTTNLAALGFRVEIPAFLGISIPTFAGPFNTFDARVSGTQSVFDYSAIKRWQASKTGVSAAKQDVETTQERVAAQVARAYLAAVKADTDVETAHANVELALALLKQAENEKAAGTGTGIEITRAKVQLANDRQRLLEAQNARHAADLRLLKAMSMRLDTELKLTDRMAYVPVEPETLEQARKAALEGRPDWKAQQEREANARISASAVKMERVPSVAAFADYGSLGTGLDNALPTRTYGVSVRVPVFDGGRRDARRAESASAYRAEKARTNDLKEQIELDVRLALDDLQAADDEVKVAQEGLGLAENELAQARRRYDAGVATGVEVTDAQTRLERAKENSTSAVYNFNVARIDLAQAMGRVRTEIR